MVSIGLIWKISHFSFKNVYKQKMEQIHIQNWNNFDKERKLKAGVIRLITWVCSRSVEERVRSILNDPKRRRSRTICWHLWYAVRKKFFMISFMKRLHDIISATDQFTIFTYYVGKSKYFIDFAWYRKNYVSKDLKTFFTHCWFDFYILNS